MAVALDGNGARAKRRAMAVWELTAIGFASPMDPDGSMAFRVARHSISAGPVAVHHSLPTENA